MGIIDLFRKKKTLKQTSPASAENANTVAVSQTNPKYNVIRGSFSNINADYQTIGKIIFELEKLGFYLSEINTSSESSSHDWTVTYRNSYTSFDDFSKRAMTDYQEACSKQEVGNPHLDWDSTRFLLINQWSVHLFALNDGTPNHNIYKTRWAVHVPENIAAEDELLQKTLNVLKKYE